MRAGTHELAWWFLLCGQLVAVEDVKWTDVLMVSGRVVFTGVIGTVEDAFPPKISELSLRVAAF